ncbi:hypothetical protein BL254_01470 [Protofrankia sp. BMG5.30]|nr:SpoIIE family protein phosphatase [Protofrankia sp. BMG5.30]ONH38117.1 hypothetical protein BL254_01470 [Protofrankia sp. BMG5.30]
MGTVPITGQPGHAPAAARSAAIDGPGSSPVPVATAAGALPPAAPGSVTGESIADSGIDNLREDGRGLSLVDALSTAWGTEHDRTGKKVWFRLDAPDGSPTDAEAAGGPGPAAAAAETARAGARTVSPGLSPGLPSSLPSSLPPGLPPGLAAHGSGSAAGPPAAVGAPATAATVVGPRRPARLLSSTLTRVLSVEEEVGELLAQLVDALPSSGAGLVRRSHNRAGAAEVVAAFGSTGSERDARRIPLDSRDGTVGELLLWSPGLPASTGRAPTGAARVCQLDDDAGGIHDDAIHGDVHRDIHGAVRDDMDGAVHGDLEERIQLVARWMALALGGAHLRRVEERRIGMLSFLAEASDLLAGSLDTDRSLALLARLPVPRLARWCTVHLLRDDGAIKLAAVGHVDEAAAGALSAWADDPAGTLVAHLQAALTDTVRVATVDGAPTVIAAMRARRRVLGVLTLGRAAGNNFEADEIELLTDLARRAAFTVDNARLFRQQVEVAGELQAGLLPPELPHIDGIELGSSYRSARAGLEVGGDFFDLVPDPDGGWTIIIGDVCGKGAEAANVTGVARAVLRLLAGQRHNLPDIMMDLNRALRDTASYPNPAGQGRFCTLAAAQLRPAGELGPPSEPGPPADEPGPPDEPERSGGPRPSGARGPTGLARPAARSEARSVERVVSICMAGHPLPVLVRADGTAVFVAQPGTLLGVLNDEDAIFPEVRVSLRAGDALVLYTDGVVEARRGRELFGEERLLATLRGCAGMSAQGIAERLRAAAERFAGGRLRDDVAVLAARIPT